MSVKPSETYDTGGSEWGASLVVEWRPRLREALALDLDTVARIPSCQCARAGRDTWRQDHAPCSLITHHVSFVSLGSRWSG
eukprot:2155797-Prymnesium_polylepis.1